MSHRLSNQERAFIETVFVDKESALEKSSEKIRGAFSREHAQLLDESSPAVRYVSQC
jgi:hypothetical protein